MCDTNLKILKFLFLSRSLSLSRARECVYICVWNTNSKFWVFSVTLSVWNTQSKFWKFFSLSLSLSLCMCVCVCVCGTQIPIFKVFLLSLCVWDTQTKSFERLFSFSVCETQIKSFEVFSLSVCDTNSKFWKFFLFSLSLSLCVCVGHKFQISKFFSSLFVCVTQIQNFERFSLSLSLPLCMGHKFKYSKFLSLSLSECVCVCVCVTQIPNFETSLSLCETNSKFWVFSLTLSLCVWQKFKILKDFFHLFYILNTQSLRIWLLISRLLYVNLLLLFWRKIKNDDSNEARYRSLLVRGICRSAYYITEPRFLLSRSAPLESSFSLFPDCI